MNTDLTSTSITFNPLQGDMCWYMLPCGLCRSTMKPCPLRPDNKTYDITCLIEKEGEETE